MTTRSVPPVAPPADAGDRHVRGMARGGGLNLIGAVLSQAAVFGIMLLLARVLGVAEVGRYAQCYAVLALLGLLSLAGFRAGLTRFVAVHLADDDPAALRGTVRLGLAISAGSSALIGVALALAAPRLADLLHDPQLVAGLRLVALTLPATTVCEAALAATRGWRTQRPFTLIGQVYEPGARLALTALALAGGAGLTGAYWALVVAAWSAAAFALAAVWRLLRRAAPAAPVYRPGPLFSFSTVSWVSSLSSTGLIWIDTLLLGAFATDDIGVYNVATRLVTIAIFVLAPINAAFGPYLASLYHRGAMDDVRRIYGAATGWVVRLSLPAFVVLLVFPEHLLRLFGGDFATGAAVTVILAVGQLVNAATGPCGTLLNMSGRVVVNMADNLAALVLNVLLNLWLIPAYGLIGAAVAWAVSLAAVNLARVLQVRALVRAVPVTGGMLKGLAAGALALLAGFGARWLASGWLVEIVVGVVVVGVVYLGAVLALGLSREDTMVLRSLIRRRGGVGRPGRADPPVAVDA
ncbi:Membrane protein involved in the export of O-antigen and teichoic acid [Micromonospora pattaloongensis]|uniref:Membrane protein involved in the export of O-antigen and teichoic acid n=1 Tax=Micromonospora pattaloongensis TaxID=405436 RepID=A0A1H3RHB5_9ACTN|nr:oligosaccharide flippase family protein [Micromonospora pattaloongensis]SDZ24973.1 Membrane protein involved in the export of O-antigen and teichoic acid [Micromonospora pattaloongensis]